MRWFKPNLRGSIYAIFSSSHPPPSTTGLAEISMEEIRDAMLGLLVGLPEDRFAHVTRRIRYAVDVQALWFLRGDLMAALASMHGEATALEEIEAVSQMFEELLPQGMRSRPSPLAAGPKD